MPCTLSLVGAFHSGQSASAPMMSPDQMVPRTERQGLFHFLVKVVKHVFFLGQSYFRGYTDRKMAALARIEARCFTDFFFC